MEFEKPLMQVKNLRKQFGNGCIHCIGKEEELQGNYCPHCGTVYALRDISFDVYDGEILGVVGESGSGKSTMMKCLYLIRILLPGLLIFPPIKRGK